MAKVEVKGKKQAPIYKWLTKKLENGKIDQVVKWNFQKFLIDESGSLVAVYLSKVSPMDKRIVAWIEGR